MKRDGTHECQQKFLFCTFPKPGSHHANAHLIQDKVAYSVARYGTPCSTLLDDSILIDTLAIHSSGHTFDFDVVVQFRRCLERVVHDTQPSGATGVSSAKVDRSPVTVVCRGSPPKTV